MPAKKVDKDAIAEAQIILAAAREELTRADGKAALLLSAVGIITGTLIAALMAGTWTPQKLQANLQPIWWIGASLGVMGITSLAYSVYPRTKYRGERPPSLISYYGHVVLTPRVELERKLSDTRKQNGSSTIDQLVAISEIVVKKYRGIQVGMWSIGGSALLCTCVVIASDISK